MELQDRVAIVTGGGVRIGRQLSLSLADAGMTVCVHCGTSLHAAMSVVREIRENGGDATVVQADLLQPEESARTIIAGAMSSFGRVDALINNAAIFEAESLSELTLETWSRHMSINLAAPAFLCREFAATRCLDNTDRAIVNIADWRALQPQVGHLSYTLSKAGLVALTKGLAQELAPGIRVNAIAPGAILPPADAADDHEQRMREVIPVERTGTPQDVAEAVLYLLRANFVTGELLHLTGGQELSVPQPWNSFRSAET